MKRNRSLALAGLLLVGLSFSPTAHAWGRHDLITRLVFEIPALANLPTAAIVPEPIDEAAPALLREVMPDLLNWCRQYHEEHDTRYAWNVPTLTAKVQAELTSGTPASPREALLWLLEDNIRTPLALGPEKSAADILIHYVDEPDGAMHDELIGPSIS